MTDIFQKTDMIQKHMKRCTNQNHNEISLHPIGWLNQKRTMTSFSQGWREKLGLSYTADGIVKNGAATMENNLGVFKTLELPYTQQLFPR